MRKVILLSIFCCVLIQDVAQNYLNAFVTIGYSYGRIGGLQQC